MENMSSSTDANDNFKQNSREREREETREKIILEEMRREDKMKRAFFEEQMQGPGSDWNDNQRIRDPYMRGDEKGQASGDRDPFSSGINREDPGDMGSYAKAWEQGKGGKRIRKAWSQWKDPDPGARIDSDRMQSVKHGIQRKPRMSFGEVLVIAIVMSFSALSYVEYSS